MAETADNAKADQKFPNLASVPEAPTPFTAEERKKMSEELIADHGNARYTAKVIRRQSEQLAPSPGGLVATASTPKAAVKKPGPPAPSSKPIAQTSMRAPPVRVTRPANANWLAQRKSVASSARTENELAKTRIQPPPASVSTPSIEVEKRLPPVRAPASRPPSRTIPAPVAQRTTQGVQDRATRFDRQSLSEIAPASGGLNRPPHGRRFTFGPPPSDIAIVQRARAVWTVRPRPSSGASSNAQTRHNGSAPNGQARFAPRQPSRIISLPRDFDSSVAVGERLARIGFAQGASAVGSIGHRLLRSIAITHRRLGGVIRVVGHASSRTRDMDPTLHALVNFQLSLDRANRVARILMSLGVPAQSIAIRAMSDNQPRFVEAMPSGEAANRRVEVFLDASG